METDSGDAVIILSSELIAEVMERYFKKEMFKKYVAVVDLKPTDAGYAFTLSFKEPVTAHTVEHLSPQESVATVDKIARGVNGRFRKREVTHE